MALQLPARIAVKRKNTAEDDGEDAPDILYLEGDERSYFRRIRNDNARSPKRRNIATAAVEDNAEVQRAAKATGVAAQSDASDRGLTGQVRPARPRLPDRKASSIKSSLRFYLSRSSSKLPTFETRAEDVAEAVSERTDEIMQDLLPTAPLGLKKPSKSARLVPSQTTFSSKAHAVIVSPAQHEGNGPQSNNVFDSMLSEHETMTLRRDDTVGTRSKPAKLKPHVPAVRARDLLKQHEATSEIAAREDDYTYDTYVLVEQMDIDVAEAEVGNLGVLLIEEDDQPLWETYFDLEAQQSDLDKNSDEEDENAEDHYGADYPEDEVDSEDEYDLDPYRFQHADASDNEDFMDSAFSDDEDSNKLFRNSSGIRRSG